MLHLHLVIANPRNEWLRFPYAVEYAWVTPDLVNNHLYLHCVVPREHKTGVLGLLRECRSWCRGLTWSWSGDGWQEIPGVGPDVMPALPAPTAAPVLREQPLVVPVAFEAWNAESMNGVWMRIRERNGGCLRDYVRRGRIYATNGKRHVREAYGRLCEHGLFRQYLVRYQGWHTGALEIFLFLQRAEEWLAEFAEAVRPSAMAIETYHGEHGNAVVRIAGNEEAVRTVLGLQDDMQRYEAHIFVHRPRSGTELSVRFCYEFLFDPTTGAWLFPHDTIMNHMRGDP